MSACCIRVLWLCDPAKANAAPEAPRPCWVLFRCQVTFLFVADPNLKLHFSSNKAQRLHFVFQDHARLLQKTIQKQEKGRKIPINYKLSLYYTFWRQFEEKDRSRWEIKMSHLNHIFKLKISPSPGSYEIPTTKQNKNISRPGSQSGFKW